MRMEIHWRFPLLLELELESISGGNSAGILLRFCGIPIEICGISGGILWEFPQKSCGNGIGNPLPTAILIQTGFHLSRAGLS